MEIALELVKLCSKGVKMFSVGQTEATSRISYLDPKFCEKKVGSIGKPIPNGKMWVENDKYEIISKAILGEQCIRVLMFMGIFITTVI